MMENHDINTLIVESLIHIGQYNLRATSKYFLSLYKETLKSPFVEQIHGKPLKKCVIIRSYFFGSVTFLRHKECDSSFITYVSDSSLIEYTVKENVDVSKVKFVMGMWNFVTGPMYFLMNSVRTKSLLIGRSSYLRVCWDKTLQCDQVKQPPDVLIFVN